MAKYKYSTISTEERLCNGEIFADNDEQAIKIGKEGKAQAIYRMITKGLKVVGWEKIYNNPSGIKH